MWQLLRLTCTTLNTRLGDYHKAHNLQMWCFERVDRLPIGTPCTYNVFVSRLIAFMGKPKYHHKRRTSVSITYSSTAGTSPTLTPHHEVIFNFDRVTLTMNKSPYTPYGYTMRRSYPADECNLGNVLIGYSIYTPCPHDPLPFHRWIYDELPELSAKMFTWKRVYTWDRL